MNCEKTKFEKICLKIFCLLITCLYVALNFYSIKSSYHNFDLKDEIVTFTSDSVFINLLFLALSYFVFIIVYHVVNSRSNLDTNRLAKIVSLIVILIGLIWVTTLLSYPMADQEFVLFSSARIDVGDYSDLSKGGYLGIYQHQLGIVTFFRLLNRIFGNFNYRGVQLVNCILGGLFAYAGYRITNILSRGNKATDIIYLILIITCAPFYGYMPYVYGEIPSITFLSLTFWMYLSYFEDYKPFKVILLFLFSVLAILVRENSIIFIIGILIASFVKVIGKKINIKIIILCIAIVLSLFTPSLIIKSMYGKHIPEDSKSLPTMVWIAMGTNTDNEDCYGSWNNWPYDLLYKNNFDMDECEKEAQIVIDEFINVCKNDKSFFVNFYTKKFVTQWNVPLYQCFVMSNVVSENLTPIAEEILYTGNNIRDYSNIYQLVVYSACLIYILTVYRHNDINLYVIFIGIFGGFIFSLLWEAKARYIFPYFMMMIPCASIGITNLAKLVKKR